MPKQKTHRGAAKRLSLTKNGLVKRAKAYKSHILNKKSTKRKRNLRKTDYVAATEAKTMKKLIPYK
ncbi:50S ribosomal protein L35 [Beduinella massiliensis]|uniref:50S ribosomal protein L35 n=1 Tax=Beduinella massiliensis TaxID=1852363 RepID=UPI000C858B32